MRAWQYAVFYDASGRCLGCAVILEALEGTPKQEAPAPAEAPKGKPFQTLVKRRPAAGAVEH
eukprot:1183398-Prorocentrum_minimum.AAC.4